LVSSIVELFVSGCGITKIGAKIIFQTLKDIHTKDNQSKQGENMRCPEIGNTTSLLWSKSVVEEPSLSSSWFLDIPSFHDEKDEEEEEEISIQPTHLSKINNGLKVLDISHNDLGEDGGVCIGEFLTSNPQTLTKLSLQGCNLKPRGCGSIAVSLRGNSHLKDLNLASNKMMDSAALDLASSLKINCVLRELNISDNQLSMFSLSTIFSAGEEEEEMLVRGGKENEDGDKKSKAKKIRMDECERRAFSLNLIVSGNGEGNVGNFVPYHGRSKVTFRHYSTDIQDGYFDLSTSQREYIQYEKEKNLKKEQETLNK